MNYSNFFYAYENIGLKNIGLNHATVSPITRKILVCGMEFCD